MKKIQTTRRSLILGASGAALCHSLPGYANTLPVFQVRLWSLERGYYDVYSWEPATISLILENSITFACQKIDNYIKENFGIFGYHSVIRDSIARAISSTAVARAIIAYKDRGAVLTASDAASQLGTALSAIFITVLQELIQLKLRRSGYTEQQAKYLAFALAWTVIGGVGLLMSGWIHDALYRNKNVTPRNHTAETPEAHPYRDELRRRQLLELPDVLNRFVFNPNITVYKPASGHVTLVARGVTFGYGESYPFQIEQGFYPNGTPYLWYWVSWKKDLNGGWIHEKQVSNG